MTSSVHVDSDSKVLPPLKATDAAKCTRAIKGYAQQARFPRLLQASQKDPAKLKHAVTSQQQINSFRLSFGSWLLFLFFFFFFLLLWRNAGGMEGLFHVTGSMFSQEDLDNVLALLTDGHRCKD